MDSAALETKKEFLNNDDIVILSTGIRARLRPVAPYLLDAVARRFKFPKPPVIKIVEKDIEEENPNDPEYLQACSEISTKQSEAIMEAFYLFGVELVDEIPSGWEKRLKRVTGIEFDESDNDERELIYKKYIAIGTQDAMKIQSLSGISSEGVREAEKQF